MIPAWITNSERQPKAWASGPPMIKPVTGAPAPTMAHQPVALARWLTG